MNADSEVITRFYDLQKQLKLLAQTILSGSEEQARDKFEVLKMIKDMRESHIQFFLEPITIDENNDDSYDENIDEDDTDERNDSMATTTPDFE